MRKSALFCALFEHKNIATEFTEGTEENQKAKGKSKNKKEGGKC